MKALFIGGTGNISTASTRLPSARGIALTLIPRGRRSQAIPGPRCLQADFPDEPPPAPAIRGPNSDAGSN